jgi:hypothetical protein
MGCSSSSCCTGKICTSSGLQSCKGWRSFLFRLGQQLTVLLLRFVREREYKACSWVFMSLGQNVFMSLGQNVLRLSCPRLWGCESCSPHVFGYDVLGSLGEGKLRSSCLWMGLFSIHRHQVPNGFPKAFPIAPKFLPVYIYIYIYLFIYLFISFNFGEGTFYYKYDWEAQVGMWTKMNFVLLDPVGRRIRINDKHPFS